ncbi:hypothetical protein AAFC00_004630 [Neodothiora populina]|uniref:H-type lectin domain-containing protein n=1 Tax=Neodothiora populina TaxID=2781224 RepID=A0ABR3P408_9PEZI
MVHLDKPGLDTGVFRTEEVRPRDKPCRSTSRKVAFFPGQYKKPPKVVAGFRSLDLSHEGPASANLIVDDVSEDSFNIGFRTRVKSTLYSASASWIEHKSSARDCLSGRFDTKELRSEDSKEDPNPRKGDREFAKEIRFKRPFQDECKVVCWLSRINMVGGESNFRIRAYATKVSPEGFTAHIDTWSDSVLNGAAMCWIAFPKNKPHVQSGSFNTSEVRSWSNPKPNNSARVGFDEDAFEPGKSPTVLVALNMLDMAGNSDLRIRVDTEKVTDRGFTWHLDTWDDSTLYSAGASWIALGFA